MHTWEQKRGHVDDMMPSILEKLGVIDSESDVKQSKFSAYQLLVQQDVETIEKAVKMGANPEKIIKLDKTTKNRKGLQKDLRSYEDHYSKNPDDNPLSSQIAGGTGWFQTSTAERDYAGEEGAHQETEELPDHYGLNKILKDLKKVENGLTKTKQIQSKVKSRLGTSIKDTVKITREYKELKTEIKQVKKIIQNQSNRQTFIQNVRSSIRSSNKYSARHEKIFLDIERQDLEVEKLKEVIRKSEKLVTKHIEVENQEIEELKKEEDILDNLLEIVTTMHNLAGKIFEGVDVPAKEDRQTAARGSYSEKNGNRKGEANYDAHAKTAEQGVEKKIVLIEKLIEDIKREIISLDQETQSEENNEKNGLNQIQNMINETDLEPN
jgi:hypothetical protein